MGKSGIYAQYHNHMGGLIKLLMNLFILFSGWVKSVQICGICGGCLPQIARIFTDYFY
jgi:hypothetical protein